MLTTADLARILRAGADSLDWLNGCTRCNAEAGNPCTDSGGSRYVDVCPDRVKGDPVFAHALRAMAHECR
jgi:hypothetical protein